VCNAAGRQAGRGAGGEGNKAGPAGGGSKDAGAAEGGRPLSLSVLRHGLVLSRFWSQVLAGPCSRGFGIAEPSPSGPPFC
jgi:hypothetical protein